MLKRGSDLLNAGVILGEVFQPHESHVPPELQFMMDYNLQGMNLIHLKHVMFRQVSWMKYVMFRQVGWMKYVMLRQVSWMKYVMFREVGWTKYVMLRQVSWMKYVMFRQVG